MQKQKIAKIVFITFISLIASKSGIAGLKKLMNHGYTEYTEKVRMPILSYD